MRISSLDNSFLWIPVNHSDPKGSPGSSSTESSSSSVSAPSPPSTTPMPGHGGLSPGFG